ncbi:MAG: hypothetical protein LBQ48_07805, partial [Oscillospiraceae bacterium]|nr:hypothetical protein [Oscillospiraceae bacterium]
MSAVKKNPLFERAMSLTLCLALTAGMVLLAPFTARAFTNVTYQGYFEAPGVGNSNNYLLYLNYNNGPQDGWRFMTGSTGVGTNFILNNRTDGNTTNTPMYQGNQGAFFQAGNGAQMRFDTLLEPGRWQVTGWAAVRSSTNYHLHSVVISLGDGATISVSRDASANWRNFTHIFTTTYAAYMYFTSTGGYDTNAFLYLDAITISRLYDAKVAPAATTATNTYYQGEPGATTTAPLICTANKSI